MTRTNRRPIALTEVADYYQTYISKVQKDDFLEVLKDNTPKVLSFFGNLSEEQWLFRYAPSKWSIKEVAMHIIDTERIMAYRALRIARGDQTPMAGYEQDDYVPLSKADERTSESILKEYEAVRQSSIQLFEYFDDNHLDTIGMASGCPFTPRALGFILAGHETHHVGVVERIYLK
ncbi:MAG: DinB family protein [Saprospiraceae bacterium]